MIHSQVVHGGDESTHITLRCHCETELLLKQLRKTIVGIDNKDHIICLEFTEDLERVEEKKDSQFKDVSRAYMWTTCYQEMAVHGWN